MKNYGLLSTYHGGQYWADVHFIRVGQSNYNTLSADLQFKPTYSLIANNFQGNCHRALLAAISPTAYLRKTPKIGSNYKGQCNANKFLFLKICRPTH